MISYICPSCSTENKLSLAFNVTNYVCKSCSKLVSTSTNIADKIIKKPTENVVLEVGSTGVLDGIEYIVVAIVVKKYGSSTYWREYYLKNKSGNNVFLSESQGHWILMFPKEKKLEEFKYYSEFEGKKYRWYESTPNSVHAAAGFFEDGLSFKLSNYKEFVNGTEMVSWEETENSKQYFWGKHIAKSKIKKAFKPPYMPDYSGVGIVQPFYFNIRQLYNVLGISAILMCLIYLYNYTTQANYEVFNQSVKFTDVYNKELVSKSFDLNGASAPLVVKLYSNVDNSWANAELSLVNESTNQVEYISQDIEKYSGYTDGESWSEGSQSKEFNFCGVAPGKYHFLISAQKQGSEDANNKVYFSKDGTKSFKDTNDGWFDVTTIATGETSAFNISSINLSNTELYQEYLAAKNLATTNPQNVTYIDTTPNNPSVDIKATWKPVTFWNLGILLVSMAVLAALASWWKYSFEHSKWSNSSNSPYPSN